MMYLSILVCCHDFFLLFLFLYVWWRLEIRMSCVFAENKRQEAQLRVESVVIFVVDERMG